MKIKKIQLTNIGPYIGENGFDFDLSDSLRRMILVGGKNGAGKTTLFKAIKICLYGCVAYGYEAINAKYYAEVEKIINTNEKLKKTGEAGVSIDLVLDDGKYDTTYTFVRQWRITGKRIAETFEVFKEGKALSLTEKGDFENYILHLLPPNLFRFYFFDGERLSDFVFNGNKDSDFREAFLKLCNLDTMEIIRSNFRRISRGIAQDGAQFESEYDSCKNDDNLAQERIDSAEEEYAEISNEIQNIDEGLALLEKTYSKSGGISKKEWKGMQEQLTKEELKREEKRRWLKDVANNVLPFIVLREQLLELKDQIVLEQKAQVDADVKTTINTPAIKSIIEQVLSQVNVEPSSDVAQKIIEDICDYTSSSEQVTPILNLSKLDQFELTAKINSLVAFDIERIKKATDDIEASLKHAKRIRKKMERSSIDNYDEYLQKKSEYNEKKAQLASRLLDVDKEIQELKANKAVTASRLAKAKANYEAALKKRSVNDISARALLAFDELQDVLYAKSIKAVEEEFKVHFNALINKSDLIDGIHIDENLNVLPYKNRHFYASDIKKTLDKNGEEYIIAQIGLHAFEQLKVKLQSDEAEFELPVEVKQQLSAGEKQIFVMALYQALSHLNKINVPYIIDTPFARIDKEHRSNILEHFFKKLKGQIMILSTDEEIVSNYMDVVSDVISNTFVLNHTSNGNTEILPGAYFGGKQ